MVVIEARYETFVAIVPCAREVIHIRSAKVLLLSLA